VCKRVALERQGNLEVSGVWSHLFGAREVRLIA
jgi:hypothetical protein